MVTDSHDEENESDAGTGVADGTDDLQVIREPELDNTLDVRTGSPDLAPSVVATLGPDGLVIDLRDRPQDELTPFLTPFLTAERLTAAEDVGAARRLSAAVYVASGFVQPEDLTVEGTLAEDSDPWVLDSTYFAVLKDGEPVATARQIQAAETSQLPALRLGGLHPGPTKAITALPGDQVVEISALARKPKASNVIDVTAVYSGMWQYSLRQGHRVWVMAIDTRVYRQLHDLFCGDAVKPIGEEQHYLGSTVVPAAIWCDDVNPEMSRRARAAAPDDGFTKLLPNLFPHPVRVP